MKTPRNNWKRLAIEGWAYIAIAAIAFAGGLVIGGLARSSKTETVPVAAPSSEAGANETGANEGEAGETGEAGAELFTGANCGSCHTLAAAGTTAEVGPNLNEFLAPDDTTEAVEEMIVNPNAELAEGYPRNVMPQDYGQTLSPAEVHQLAEYLVATTPANPGP